MLQLQLISQLCKCEFYGPLASNNLIVGGISIDSRTLRQGELFCAIRGDRFDGHAFIDDAIAHVASAIICEQKSSVTTVPILVVPSTLHALATMAIYQRQLIMCPIIALTGSNGKTTVKEMIAAILPQPAYATPGNFNNHIGVPLSMLQLTQ